MNTPFDMTPFLAFGYIGICIFIGVFLRSKIKGLQSYLVPACMIGGILGMIVMNTGVIPLDINLFQTIAYHFFIVSFISIGLTRALKDPDDTGHGKRVLGGAFWMGCMNGASMASQAVIGAALVIVLSAIGFNIPQLFGFFLPLGYTQGPGQALAIGKAWEAVGLTNAISFGLAVAAFGFVFALFVGIPIVNWGIRKGYSAMGKSELPDYFRRGVYREEQIEEPVGLQTTHSGNVDALAFQGGAVGIAYLLAYFGYWVFEQFFGTISSATWGFFFFYGMIAGVIIKVFMQKTGSAHLLDRQTQNRITGFGVDVLVTATLISVKLSVVWEYIVPLLILVIVGGLWTTLLILYFGRRVDGPAFERMCVQYGINTGTISTGLLLLRIVDPKFKTSAAIETGIYPFFSNFFVLPVMLVIVFGPKWGLNIYQQMGIFAGIFVLIMILLKVFRLWGKKTW